MRFRRSRSRRRFARRLSRGLAPRRKFLRFRRRSRFRRRFGGRFRRSRFRRFRRGRGRRFRSRRFRRVRRGRFLRRRWSRRRFGRGRKRFGKLPYIYRSIDAQTISNSIKPAATPGEPGLGRQAFNDVRSLGELNCLYLVLNDAVTNFARKLFSHPLGPKWGGPVRPYGADLAHAITMPDVWSRMDPNYLWVRMRERIKYRLYNVGNTIAYITIHRYFPKKPSGCIVTPAGSNFNGLCAVKNYRQLIGPVYPPNTLGAAKPTIYPPLSGVPALAAVWGYPLHGINSNELWQYPFQPPTYTTYPLLKPRLLGAYLQQGPAISTMYMGQDVSGNLFNAGGNTTTGPDRIMQRVLPQSEANTARGDPMDAMVGIHADNGYADSNNTDQFLYTRNRNKNTPGTYANNTDIAFRQMEDIALANSFETVDFSLWPQYSERRNQVLRSLFRIRSRRLTLSPGQVATWTVKGRPFSFNPIRHGLWSMTDSVSGLPNFTLSADADVTAVSRVHQRPQYMGHASGPYYDANLDIAMAGNTAIHQATPCMTRGAGMPTNTVPMCIQIRGQTAADSKVANSLQILPAVCVLKKEYTARYGIKMAPPPHSRRHRTIINNLSDKAAASFADFLMQFPVVTSTAEPTVAAGAFP